MPSHKHHEQLEKIKDAVKGASHLTEEEKSSTLQHIEEWYKEDKASGIIYEELLEITQKIEPILKELGLL